MIEIRPSTLEDFTRFRGQEPPVTVRAMTVVKDGEIRCIAGITYEGNASIAFSEAFLDGVSKRDILKVARELTKWMKEFHPAVILTEADKSHKFIEKLGFEHIVKEGGTDVYRL